MGCWLGAFDRDLLVGDLGIFADGHVGRYQSVETRPSHRGLGICPALLTTGARWVAHHSPNATRLIETDQHEVAGQIYRRCGFVHTETLISACRKPLDA
ncbi:GNAT family N-acetyltransferase [Actibacterium sp. 188UL27-1]|nr:GNAT family N-acetyltransferase [Actibacterium sp. 188UL27-1]MBM7069614.1 GNAT family N-acetyltransferase [Actibacterium sp. 188UL27-1]